MLANPLLACIAQGVRVAQLGADRPEVAGSLAVDRTGRLDRHMLTTHFEFAAQFGQGLEDHRLSAGEHNVLDSKALDLFEDFRDAVGGSFGFPGGIAGVAIPTAEIAAAGTDENAGRSGQETFTLYALKNLGNPDQSAARYKRLSDFRRGWTLLYFGGLAKILQALSDVTAESC